MARALVAHTANEIDCLAQAGKFLRNNQEPGFVREQAGGEATSKAYKIGAALLRMGSVVAAVRIVR